jgi:hypothetical protein
LRLRRQLGRGYADGFPDLSFSRLLFPKFDLAYASWWTRSQSTTLSRENNFLPEESDTVEALLEVIAAFPLAQVIELPAKFLSLLEKLGDARTRWAYREWIQYISRIESRELIQLLPQVFAEDLEEQLRVRSRRGKHTDRCVLFLDTYEALWELPHRRVDFRWHEQDDWVRTICKTLTRALVGYRHKIVE